MSDSLSEKRLGEAMELLSDCDRILWLTGAGVSAESGIPTFRGEDGYWTVGSAHYRPEELATFKAFSEMPHSVWEWYLYRRSVCRNATPNKAHHSIAQTLNSTQSLLLTQNVDGLHLRAGSEPQKTLEIHGNIDFMRCAANCSSQRVEVPHEPFADWTKQSQLSGSQRAVLTCDCGAPMRPHVLWFDESYNEEYYRFESAQNAVGSSDALIVVGTSGQTNLPNMVVTGMVERGVPVVVVNADASRFSEKAEGHPNGIFLQGKAGTWIPKICQRLMN